VNKKNSLDEILYLLIDKTNCHALWQVVKNSLQKERKKLKWVIFYTYSLKLEKILMNMYNEDSLYIF
jgi:hypothetical protein